MFDFFKEGFDYKIFLLAVLLGFIGVISVNSATYNSGMHGFFVRDIIWQVAGLVLAISVMFSSNRFLQNSAYFFYAVTILLLVFVLVAGRRVSGHCELDRVIRRRRTTFGTCKGIVDSFAFKISF